MEDWRRTWRDGWVPLLSTAALRALAEALERDDPLLIQGATTQPPPMECTKTWPVERACAIGYCGWQGESIGTVDEVEQYFAHLCYECDLRLGAPAACRWFLNWFDETPRDAMRAALLPEVRLALQEREAHG